MKITEEWLKGEIFLCEKNEQYLKELIEKDKNYTSLYHWELGRLDAFQHVLMRKKISNRTSKVFPINVPQWKRNIIRFLTRICDRLEGVEDKRLFEKDILEKRSDNARKRSMKYRNHK